MTDTARTTSTSSGTTADDAHTASTASAPHGDDAPSTPDDAPRATAGSSRRWSFPPIATSMVLAALAAVAGFVLADVIADRRAVVVAGVAAAAGLVAATVAWSVSTPRPASTTAPSSRRLLLVVAGIGVLGAALTAIGVSFSWPRPGQPALRGAIEGVTGGWAQLVTSPVPANAEPQVLAPVAVAVFAAAFGGVIAQRGANRAAPLLPSVASYVGAAVAAGATQADPMATAGGYLAGAAAVLFLRHPRFATAYRQVGTSTSTAGRVARALPAAAVAVALAVGAALVAGPQLATDRSDDPFDPRDHLDPPTVPSAADNPLALVSQRLRLPDDVLFTVRADRPLKTRLAAFDSFDGASWSASGSWRRAGTTINAPNRSGVDVEDVVATITVERLDGPWLPSFGDTTSVRGIEAIVDPASGSLATDVAFESGLSYTVGAEVPSFESANLAGAALASDGSADAALMLPEGVPEPLQTMAETATAGGSAPFQQAALLALYMKQSFRLDPDQTPGHSYAHLVRSFPGTGVGTDEQFAGAFAVMGRLLGMPTRVVVGFDAGTEVSPGVYEVRAGDVTVWPEVRFAGAGWVEFNPSPSDEADPRDDNTVTIGGQSVTLEEQPTPTTLPPTQSNTPDRPDRASDDESTVATWLRRGAVAAVVAAAAITLAALGAWLVKRRRTSRRRRAAEPRQRVLGAWADVLDRLTDSGAPTVEASTIEEHLAEVEDESASLAGLYWPVTRALYGSNEITPDDADQAWRARDRFVTSLVRREPVGVRIRHAVGVRSLRRTAHATNITTTPGNRRRSRHPRRAATTDTTATTNTTKQSTP